MPWDTWKGFKKKRKDSISILKHPLVAAWTGFLGKRRAGRQVLGSASGDGQKWTDSRHTLKVNGLPINELGVEEGSNQTQPLRFWGEQLGIWYIEMGDRREGGLELKNFTADKLN